jgi:hypothetical protein
MMPDPRDADRCPHRLWTAATAAADPGALDVAVLATLLELPGAFAAGDVDNG